MPRFAGLFHATCVRIVGMDENPYKTPDDDGTNAPDPHRARQSGFFDPTRNAVAILILGAIVTWAIVSSIIWAG